MSELLEKARSYEAKKIAATDKESKPLFHISAPAGWINDPNGFSVYNGKIHLFYQYYPYLREWGPMHWGHAVSTDLLHWEHKEIALYPDELGYIFSGSCVLDVDNVSGFGSRENPPLIAIYTNHAPDNGQQQQSIAYSLDYEHFIKYEGNPVIPNTQEKDFRDPKVFVNRKQQGYTMALAAGKRILFYHTMDFKKWELTGSFEPGKDNNGVAGICECPDCFQVETAQGRKWILSISMIALKESGEEDHVMQYYVGEFDGRTFQAEQKAHTLDYGTDNYAAVTFQNAKDAILLGWADSWEYVYKVPAQDYRGTMTLARKLTLQQIENQYYLCQKPVGIEAFPVVDTPEPDGIWRMHICYDQAYQLSWQTQDGAKIELLINDTSVITKRTHPQETEAALVCSAPRLIAGEAQMDIVADGNLIEIYAENGLVSMTVKLW